MPPAPPPPAPPPRRRPLLAVALLVLGFAVTVGAKVLVGDAFDRAVGRFAAAAWLTGEVPCAFLAMAVLLSVAFSVALLLFLLDPGSRPMPGAAFAFAGSVVATWFDVGVPFAFVAGVGCSAFAAVVAAIEVRRRRLRYWWPAVPCMLALVVAELLAFGGIAAFTGW